MFIWQIDRNGYDLSDDGTRIVRRGGELQPYRPDDVDPSPGYVFANLGSQILQAGQLSRRRVRGNPFWSRQFKDMPSALIAFVREYGFLGSPNSAADAASEAIDYLDQQHGLLAVCYDIITGAPIASAIKAFNRDVTPHMTVRLELGDDGKAHVKALPRSLSAWMWVRVAEEIAAGVSWAHCEWCEKPMARGGGRGQLRVDARFCSASCRTMSNHQKAIERERGK